MDVTLSVGNASKIEQYEHASLSKMIPFYLSVVVPLFNSDTRLREFVHLPRAVILSFAKFASDI